MAGVIDLDTKHDRGTAVALTADGRAHAWGLQGPLCPDGDQPTPTLVRGQPRLRAVAVLTAGALGLTDSGDVYAWGSTALGLLGAGEQPTRSLKPTRIRDLRDVVAISAEEGNAAALSEDGSVRTWGLGAAGRPPTGRNVEPIAAVTGLPPVRRIDCGGTTVIALTRAGTLWQWGRHVGCVGRRPRPSG